MVEQAMEKQATAWHKRHGDRLVMRHIGITDLPITSLEMDHRPLRMAPRNNAHTAIFGKCLVQGDPGTDDRLAKRDIKVCLVLMPWLLAADEGRLDQRHIL